MWCPTSTPRFKSTCVPTVDPRATTTWAETIEPAPISLRDEMRAVGDHGRELDAERRQLRDVLAAPARCEAADGDVVRRERGDVVDPAHRKPLQRLGALLPVEVLDEARDVEPRLGCDVRDLDRERARAEDEQAAHQPALIVSITRSTSSSVSAR